MIVRTIIPFCVLVFGIFYFCLRILGTHLEFIPGDLGDSRFINYILEHGYLFLKGDDHSFWDAPFMYPYPNTVAISDNMLGTMPVYALLRYFGFSMESSYQLWWIFICVLNYLCSYFVFKKLTNHVILSSAFAYVFAFGLFNITHLNYMQTIIRFNVPLVIYFAYKLIETPNRKYLFFYVFGLVFQFYCVIYTGFYLLYASLLFILCYTYLTKKKVNLKFYIQRNNILNSCLILGIGTILMCFLMYPYIITAFNLGLRSYGEAAPNIPTIGSYFFAHESSILWNFLFDPKLVPHESWWLQNIFPGIIPVLCFMIPVIYLFIQKRKKQPVNSLLLALVITCAITFVLFAKTAGGLTLYRIIFVLPGMSAMRVVPRFVHVQLFMALLLGALFFMKQNKWLIYGLALLCVIDNLFNSEKVGTTAKAEIQKHKQSLVSKIKSYDFKNYKAIAYIADNDNPFFVKNIDAMVASQSLNIKCVNGYSSACPGEFGEMFSKCNQEGLDSWLKASNIPEKDILIIK